MLKIRKLHRYLGLIMLLPMICWAITGTIFFIKPGYKNAYEMLKVKTYPLEQSITIPEHSSWQEVRVVKTILGLHLLVRSDGPQQKTMHLKADTLEPWLKPKEADIKRLIEDAFTGNQERYGVIESFDDNTAVTSTKVRVNFNWDTLSLSQKGNDTDLINLIYKVHYLQWTPWDGVNQVLGVVGLLFLVTLSILGIRIYLRGRR
ncbi:MAG: PepSY domain-containing protein [Gammaproteobacteria bacterium]|nr:PepSY domain-containing protein [Gammaproteobacteria bacterium]